MVIVLAAAAEVPVLVHCDNSRRNKHKNNVYGNWGPVLGPETWPNLK